MLELSLSPLSYAMSCVHAVALSWLSALDLHIFVLIYSVMDIARTTTLQNPNTPATIVRIVAKSTFFPLPSSPSPSTLLTLSNVDEGKNLRDAETMLDIGPVTFLSSSSLAVTANV